MRVANGVISENYLKTENQWTTTVEVSFPIGRYDLKQIFDDDDELDYMHRAWERFRSTLEDLVKDGKISSYRLREVPHRIDMKL